MLLNPAYNIDATEFVPTASSATVTVPAGTVASNLTAFPLMIDLADMPSAFWAGVQADGGNVRVYQSDGVTLIPHDLTFINKTGQTGRIFAKTGLLAASDSTVVVKTLSTLSSKLAVTDANGRNAVWSDYEVVWIFPDKSNRTGKSYSQVFGAAITSPETPGPREDWAQAAYAFAYATVTAIPTMWTAGASIYLSHPNTSDYRQGYISIANGADHGNRESLTYDWTPNGLLTWNSTDLRMNWPNNPALGSTFRAAMTHDNTVSRKGYFNGALSVTDLGCAVRPVTSTNYEFIMNATMIDSNYVGHAWYQHVWIRHEVLSDAWLAADAANMNNPGSFYTVT